MIQINIRLEVEYGDVKVEVYPSGSRLKHPFISANRDRGFEKKLEKIAGEKIENLSCVRILFYDGTKIAFQIVDDQMIIGVGIVLA